MGIFKRLRDLTAASINDLLDKAEDPVKMLNQFLRDMEEDIMEAEAAVAKQIAVEKKFKQQYEEAFEMVSKREEQAMKALEQGNEDLARRALADKKEHQARYDEMKRQYDIAKTNADQLRSQLSEMKDEFNKMKNKKDLLIARAEAAKAQKNDQPGDVRLRYRQCGTRLRSDDRESDANGSGSSSKQRTSRRQPQLGRRARQAG